MNKEIPIGISDFKELIERNYYYIDKTLFIKEAVIHYGIGFKGKNVFVLSKQV